jgi:hypothetical protein
MKRRMKRTTIGTLSLVGLFTAAALAWFVLGTIEGTGTTKSGKATPTNIPVKVVIHEGVTPTQEEPIEAITVENTANPNMIEVVKMTPTITTANEVACPASNISIVPNGPESFEATKFWTGIEVKPHFENVQPGESLNLVGPGPVKEMANIKMAAAAPTGCENVEIKNEGEDQLIAAGRRLDGSASTSRKETKQWTEQRISSSGC